MELNNPSCFCNIQVSCFIVRVKDSQAVIHVVLLHKSALFKKKSFCHDIFMMSSCIYTQLSILLSIYSETQ